MPFIGDLEYERVRGKESFVGRSVYKLTQPLGFVIGPDRGLNPEYTISCESGYETDFASIPEWIFFIRSKNGKWAKASVIHDKACNLASTGVLTYKTADDIFYYAMIDDQASKFTAWFLYLFCRVNHLIVKGK